VGQFERLNPLVAERKHGLERAGDRKKCLRHFDAVLFQRHGHCIFNFESSRTRIVPNSLDISDPRKRRLRLWRGVLSFAPTNDQISSYCTRFDLMLGIVST
jgi:hypothetical protein